MNKREMTCPNCGKLHKCAGHYPTDPRSKDMLHSCEHCGVTFKTPDEGRV